MSNSFNLGLSSQVVSGSVRWYTTPAGEAQRLVYTNNQYFYNGQPWTFPAGVTEADLSENAPLTRAISTETILVTSETTAVALPNIPSNANSAIFSCNGFIFLTSSDPSTRLPFAAIEPNVYNFPSKAATAFILVRLPTLAEALLNPTATEALRLGIFVPGQPVEINVTYSSKETDQFSVIGPPFALSLASIARVAAQTPNIALPIQGSTIGAKEERQQLSVWAAEAIVAQGFSQPAVGANANVTFSTTLGFYPGQRVRLSVATVNAFTRYGTYLINSIVRPTTALTAVHIAALVGQSGTLEVASSTGFTIGSQVQIEQGLWGTVTGTTATTITYTAYRAPYHRPGFSLAAGLEVVSAGPGVANLTLLDTPMRNFQADYLAQQGADIGTVDGAPVAVNIPANTFITNATMLENIPTLATMANVQVSGSLTMFQAIQQNAIAPNTSTAQLTAQAGSDYARFAIGPTEPPDLELAGLIFAGGLYDGARTFPINSTINFDGLPDLMAARFYSPMVNANDAAVISVGYTRGVL